MKITFSSDRQHHSDQPHEPEFTPYVFSERGLGRGSPGQPVEWGPDGRVVGLIGTICLGEGSYVVNLEFEAAELKNWIKRYVEDNPREAVRLLVKMLQLAVDSMDKREEPQEKT